MKIKSICFTLAFSALGCGTKNTFQPFEKEDPAQESCIDMENQDPDKAIDVLQKALAKDPDDWKLVSLLSEAFSQKFGVDIIDLALAMAGSSSHPTATSSSGITSKIAGIAVLWPFLPVASRSNINGVDYALAILETIPKGSRTDADDFKLIFLSTASVSIHLKFYDKNHDDQLSLSELAAMSTSDAEKILGNIVEAALVASSIGGQGTSSAQAISKISSLSDTIDQQEGDSATSKITSYFQNEQGTGT